MSCFESKEVYENLAVFFASDANIVREIFISSFISDGEFKVVEEEFRKVFSKDFFIVIKEARKMQPHQALNALNCLYKDLEKEYEDPFCEIIVAKALDEQEKFNIEEKLEAKYGKLRFSYKVDSQTVGGMIFKIGKVYYDASFSKILAKLKKEVQNECF